MTEQPERLLEEIMSLIDEYDAKFARGDFDTLEDFDKKIGRLCEEALQLKGNLRHSYAEKLQDVMLSLQRLQTTMTQARDEMAKRLSTVSANKKAHIAYQKTESSDKKN